MMQYWENILVCGWRARQRPFTFTSCGALSPYPLGFSLAEHHQQVNYQHHQQVNHQYQSVSIILWQTVGSKNETRHIIIDFPMQNARKPNINFGTDMNRKRAISILKCWLYSPPSSGTWLYVAANERLLFQTKKQKMLMVKSFKVWILAQPPCKCMLYL